MNTSQRPQGGGLEGVVVGETRLSRVDGEAGRLTIAGYPVEALAPAVRFEEALHLLWHDRLPDSEERGRLATALAAARALPAEVLEVLRRAAAVGAAPMDALRLGIAALGLRRPDRLQLVGATPAIVASFVRLREGSEPVVADPGWGYAHGFLAMLRGEPPSPAAARALDTYLVTVCDHGMNASTFTARVVASTGSTVVACVEAALGALQGPLHGGAPGPALEALLRLVADGTPDTLDARTRAWVREEVAAGRRIMGFGHRVYRVRDPRADVLGAAAERLLAGSSLLHDARVHERAVLETLAELKPGRPLATNVEFYTALLLHGLGLPPELFTAVFAMGRVAGWTAHIAEQVAEGRLIRPRAAYVGAEGRVLPT
ncbi:MAG: citrate synthase [Nannocystaceae bacterium]